MPGLWQCPSIETSSSQEKPADSAELALNVHSREVVEGSGWVWAPRAYRARGGGGGGGFEIHRAFKL